MIKGAIFDMDGVLLDNLEFHLEAFLQSGMERGKELTREDVQALFGRKNKDMIEQLLGCELDEREVEDLGGRKEEIYRELITPHLQDVLVPGLLFFIQELMDQGMRLALATSGPVENVDLVVDSLEIRSAFSAVVTGEQVRHGKPNPEAFLTASEGLQIRPEKCVVFEDSFAGVEAALAAGCKCIAVATTHAAEELEAYSPDLIIQDFSAIEAVNIQNYLWKG